MINNVYLFLMDLSKFFHNKKFTDFTLILKDKENIISLRVHRIFLAESCEYFDRMFHFNPDKVSEEMIVSNINVMYDIIKSFYGISTDLVDTHCLYKLEMMKCRNFLCLPNDVTILYNLSVPSEHFDLLLEVINYFDIVNDKKLLKMLKRNLPPDYDITTLPNEILQALTKKELCLIYGGKDTIVRMWNVETEEIVHDLVGHSDKIWSVLISNDNQNIISGSEDNNIYVWNIDTGKIVKNLRSHLGSRIYSIAMSKNGQFLVSGHSAGDINMWDLLTGNLKYTTKCEKAARAVSFSPNAEMFITSHVNNINLWNSTTGKLINIIEGKNQVYCIAFSANGKYIVAGHRNGYINIWNVNTNNLMISIKGHNEKIWSVAFSNDNKKIVSGGCDKIIKLWCAETGQLIYSYKVENIVYHLVFSSDDNFVASGHAKGFINIWNRKTNKLISMVDTSSDSIFSVALGYF